MVRKNQFFPVLIVFLLGVCPGWALADTYSGGTGEPDDPYRIATPEDMQAIGADPNDWDKHFVLVADINLADYTNSQFNIIGYWEKWDLPNNVPFRGVFDGNGHSILNFTYEANDADFTGLFGWVYDPNAEIRDLTLIDPNVHVAGYDFSVGAVVGWMKDGTVAGCSIEGGSVSGYELTGALVGCNGGTISGCYGTASVSGDWNIGGLVGDNYGIISDCHFMGNVTGNECIGGLVGYNSFGGTIANCYATGSISGSRYVGGLVGRNGETYEEGSIENSYATGSVSGDDGVGGLVGINWDGTISACYSTASVSGRGVVGGLVGCNGLHEWGKIEDSYATGSVSGDGGVGGLVGCNWQGTILNCYAVGAIDGNSDMGGLVGFHSYGYYTSCFWDGDVNPDVNGIGNTTDANVIGKPTTEMQQESTFTDAGWDFVEIWDIGENQTYPFLRQYPAGDINHDDKVNFLDVAIIADHWLEGAGQ